MESFGIYMLKPEYAGRLFRSYDGKVKREMYTRVYGGHFPQKMGTIEKLEYVYELLNIRHPAGYECRSLSVSDIVCIGEGAYFCDDFGWEKVPDFLPDSHTAEWSDSVGACL